MYEFHPDFIQSITSGKCHPRMVYESVKDVVHSIRETYPELAIASVVVKVPITLEVIVEGVRLSESDARLTAWHYATKELHKSTASVRSYSAVLKEETGQTLRQALVIIGTPAVNDPPTSSEVQAAWDAAVIK